MISPSSNSSLASSCCLLFASSMISICLSLVRLTLATISSRSPPSLVSESMTSCRSRSMVANTASASREECVSLRDVAAVLLLVAGIVAEYRVDRRVVVLSSGADPLIIEVEGGVSSPDAEADEATSVASNTNDVAPAAVDVAADVAAVAGAIAAVLAVGGATTAAQLPFLLPCLSSRSLNRSSL
eukprot:CAMPEP_0197444982 /NCGR_PEP_ID=MMETSP1175-20131217/10312_2 /TAXON_ID=1003142 /ORGANISM="Triceratium dubium, Strain CCMP147" /LENGTH=184 /DNA_ID=CAMNT_0042975861 /DNA_START=95 /DNA_END=647 /DNA_ORIENTATION=-